MSERPAGAMYLYETHIPVASTQRSATFYADVVGLTFAYRDPGRDIVFLYAGANRQTMLGLWGPDTGLGLDMHHCHLAFAVTLDELHRRAARLKQLGIVTRDFAGTETTVPSVIGWMPSAQIYFEDPDGHSVEFIALLHDAPDATFIGTLADWQAKRSP